MLREIFDNAWSILYISLTCTFLLVSTYCSNNLFCLGTSWAFLDAQCLVALVLTPLFCQAMPSVSAASVLYWQTIILLLVLLWQLQRFLHLGSHKLPSIHNNKSSKNNFKALLEHFFLAMTLIGKFSVLNEIEVCLNIFQEKSSVLWPFSK